MQSMFESEDGSGDAAFPVDEDTKKKIDELGSAVDAPSKGRDGSMQKKLFG